MNAPVLMSVMFTVPFLGPRPLTTLKVSVSPSGSLPLSVPMTLVFAEVVTLPVMATGVLFMIVMLSVAVELCGGCALSVTVKVNESVPV